MARPVDPFSQRQREAAWRRGSGSVAVNLPPGGYAGPFPDWPMDDEPATAELNLWNELWRTPQASRWVDAGYDRVVARYVRLYCLADVDPKGTYLSELRQIEDRLGLSALGMRRLGWQIGVPREQVDKPVKPEQRARDRYSTLRASD